MAERKAVRAATKAQRPDDERQRVLALPFPAPDHQHVHHYRVLPPRPLPPSLIKSASQTRLRLKSQSRAVQHHEEHRIHVSRGQGHALLPSPRYVDDASTPRYTAFRLVNCFDVGQQDTLLRLIGDFKKSGLKTKTTPAHGEDFHQWWFGTWCRYAKTATITATQTTANKQRSAAINAFMTTLDSMLGKTSDLIRDLDGPTSGGMHYHHRNVASLVRDTAAAHPGTPQAMYLKQDEHRGNNHKFRIGGIGTMLAISSGEGTAYHYDTHDDQQHYSIVTCLGLGGILHLPETGYSLHVRPGDVLGFLANQQYHKFQSHMTGSAVEQVVLTIWTDSQTNRKSKARNDHREYRSLWQPKRRGDVTQHLSDEKEKEEEEEEEDDIGVESQTLVDAIRTTLPGSPPSRSLNRRPKAGQVSHTSKASESA